MLPQKSSCLRDCQTEKDLRNDLGLGVHCALRSALVATVVRGGAEEIAFDIIPTERLHNRSQRDEVRCPRSTWQQVAKPIIF